MDEEQLPVPKHKLHNWPHFFGLYGAEHVAATEVVFGATFVAMGAGLWDVLIGLIIGNTLATLSFTLLTARIAIDIRLSVSTYLDRIAGASTSRIYNGANVLIFAVISAAMITVSATAFTALAELPPQVEPYPTNIWFVVTVVAVSAIVVLVAVYRFNALSDFASICAPWLMAMFLTRGMVSVPALADVLVLREPEYSSSRQTRTGLFGRSTRAHRRYRFRGTLHVSLARLHTILVSFQGLEA